MSVPGEILCAQRVIYDFCQRAVPRSIRGHYRLEFRTHGHSITLYESRPSWIPTIQCWLRIPVAQFRFDAQQKTWRLYRPGRARRWLILGDVPPSPDVRKLLNELRFGPSGISFS